MAGLLFTGAGLTVAAASAVPGGVKMSGRRQGDTGSPFEIRGDEKFDSGGSASAEKSGMAAYVQKAVQSPHRSVRINRSGSVIVEDATTTVRAFTTTTIRLCDCPYKTDIYFYNLRTRKRC
jgi:hypothetical protein